MEIAKGEAFDMMYLKYPTHILCEIVRYSQEIFYMKVEAGVIG